MSPIKGRYAVIFKLYYYPTNGMQASERFDTFVLKERSNDIKATKEAEKLAKNFSDKSCVVEVVQVLKVIQSRKVK